MTASTWIKLAWVSSMGREVAHCLSDRAEGHFADARWDAFWAITYLYLFVVEYRRPTPKWTPWLLLVVAIIYAPLVLHVLIRFTPSKS